MIIISLGNSDKLAKSLAKKLNTKYSRLTLNRFPDSDIYLKYNCIVKNQTVVLVNTFHPEANWALYTTIFAAETARDLGAKKVILVAPYLAFMRQDKRFNPGEAVSSRIMAKLLEGCIDQLITFDAHLHRYRTFKALFKISAKNLTANNLIADYILKQMIQKQVAKPGLISMPAQQPLLMGPDWESSQWARRIAKSIGADSTILEKKRHSARKVKVKLMEKTDFKDRNVVIVDDIISTGHTALEAAKLAWGKGAKSVTAIAVHGLFVEQAYEKLRKLGVKVVTTNTIEHKSNGIDVVPMVVKELKS